MTGGTGGCATVGTTGACCNWIVPAGITSIVIEIWGGGGGGGAPPTCQCCIVAGGGGGGSYARKTLEVAPGSAYTICVGGGGLGGIPTTQSTCCCGLKGGTTYMTGSGLGDFCAEGGYGGESRCSSFLNIVSPNGGWPGSGGDLNARGYDGGFIGQGKSDFGTSNNGWTWGGGSPFGGRNIYMGFDCCSVYVNQCATSRGGGICGFTGSFPGGGGTGGWASCCCGICACGGNGAPGLVRIWM